MAKRQPKAAPFTGQCEFCPFHTRLPAVLAVHQKQAHPRQLEAKGV